LTNYYCNFVPTFYPFFATTALWFTLTNAKLIIQTEDATIEIHSVPIKLEGNTNDWTQSIQGQLVVHDDGASAVKESGLDGLIIGVKNPAANRDTLEVWLNEVMAKYNPTAFLLIGGPSIRRSFGL